MAFSTSTSSWLLPSPRFHDFGLVRFGYMRSTAAWILVGGILAMMLAGLWYILYRPLWSPDALTWLGLGVCAFGGLLIFLTPGVPLSGFCGMYALYLALSHFGFVGALLVSEGALTGLDPWMWSWSLTPERSVAVALSTLGMGALILGAAVSWHIAPRVSPRQWLERSEWPGIYWLGMAMLAFAACYMVSGVASGTMPVLSSYTDYRGAAVDSMQFYPDMAFALATGLAFTMASGDRRQRRRAILLFAIPAVLIGMAGSRGPVLWPIVTAVAVCSVRGYRPGLRLVIGGLILFFIYIPVAAQVRSQGIRTADLQDVDVHWTAPFVINGFTLRPLVYTVRWIDEGEDFARGETYTVPAQRVVGRVMPFVERPAYDAVPTSWEILHARIPTQGYTVIAEAYYNFGIPGVLVILACIGAFLSRFGDRASGTPALAFGGALLVVLIDNIRNYSVFVPGRTVLIFSLWVAGLVLTTLVPIVRRRIEPVIQQALPCPADPVVVRPTPPGQSSWLRPLSYRGLIGPDFQRIPLMFQRQTFADSAKRAFDIVGSVLLLVLAAPLCGAIALAIRFELGSPVLFRQWRAGLRGRPIMVVKFRTMREASRSDGTLLPDGARLTKLGRFLRATSLDELPELWNVVRGDMSLVGPRPLLLEYIPRYSPEQARRLEVRPGITGWSQINGRNALSWEEKLRLDSWYVVHRSLTLDLKILLRTPFKVLLREGINQPGHATTGYFQGDGR